MQAIGRGVPGADGREGDLSERGGGGGGHSMLKGRLKYTLALQLRS